MGSPDAFVITVDEVNGEWSRFESWSYLNAGVLIDFVDGEVLWETVIDDVPDGSLLPLDYAPDEFVMLSSSNETFSLLDGAELTPVDSAVDFDVEGAELWAGEQLALGFVDDRLIYVESFVLAPGEQEVAA